MHKPGTTQNFPNISELPPGTAFFSYIIEKRLGMGGMGVVYKAKNTQTNATVAIKLLLSCAPRQLLRFKREVETLAKISHPNIVKVISFQEKPYPFFCMEYVEGISLAEKILQGPNNFSEMAKVIRDIAYALDSLHQQNIIHRDIKPSNIMIRQDGTPLLMDFGIVKIEDSKLSYSKETLGTPIYMSPEQASAKPLDATSDIYSLGATLYHAITRQPPFDGTAFEIIYRVVEVKPLEPRKINSDIPEALEAICMKCMEKKPKKRYKDIKLLIDDLQKFLDGKLLIPKRKKASRSKSPKANRSRSNHSKNNHIVTIAAVVSVLLALSLIIVAENSHQNTLQKQQEALQKQQQEALQKQRQENFLKSQEFYKKSQQAYATQHFIMAWEQIKEAISLSPEKEYFLFAIIIYDFNMERLAIMTQGGLLNQGLENRREFPEIQKKVQDVNLKAQKNRAHAAQISKEFIRKYIQPSTWKPQSGDDHYLAYVAHNKIGNQAAAQHHLEKAKMLGAVEAKMLVKNLFGKVRLSPNTRENDPEVQEVIKTCTELSQAGHPQAMDFLGYVYLVLCRKSRDIKHLQLSAYWYQQAYDHFHLDAFCSYAHNIAPTINPNEPGLPEQLYLKSAEGGHYRAIFTLYRDFSKSEEQKMEYLRRYENIIETIAGYQIEEIFPENWDK